MTHSNQPELFYPKVPPNCFLFIFNPPPCITTWRLSFSFQVQTTGQGGGDFQKKRHTLSNRKIGYLGTFRKQHILSNPKHGVLGGLQQNVPLLVLRGIYHYWTYLIPSRRLFSKRRQQTQPKKGYLDTFRKQHTLSKPKQGVLGDFQKTAQPVVSASRLRGPQRDPAAAGRLLVPRRGGNLPLPAGRGLAGPGRGIFRGGGLRISGVRGSRQGF